MSLEKHTLFRLQEREDRRREEHIAAAREIGTLGRAIFMREGSYFNTKRTIRGLLFPSLASRPFLVSVPVRSGYHFGASAHHCEYETWVPHCPPLHRSWDPFGFDEEGCHSFRVATRQAQADNHAREDGGGPAHDCYVAFYVPKHTAAYDELPKNRALRVPKLRGNVLVMRMSNGLRDAFAVDVKVDEDLDILPQKVFEGLHPAARRAHRPNPATPLSNIAPSSTRRNSISLPATMRTHDLRLRPTRRHSVANAL
ncbi:hypothetical protein DFP72DRAFT_855943 [Ephemerocybe angulata]|uniref:Uncharacterized protein n=1 Tax=Ephemerocybe angulata TaxID=980116 RepID=A0A8H6LZ62_9AGAR|nr:hypothetical protein DFP72DRAFT_855943 [Tulosesus angulatus]